MPITQTDPKLNRIPDVAEVRLHDTRAWLTRVSPNGDVTITPADDHTSWLAPKMVVGANVKSSSFARIAANPIAGAPGPLAGARVTRTFCQPGEGILPMSHPRRQVPVGVAEHLSFKDWPSDTEAVAAIVKLLDTIPAYLQSWSPLLPELRRYREPWQAPDLADGGFSMLLTYKHEGEPDCIAEGISVRTWRRRHRIAYDTIRGHRNGHLVGYIPIQTRTWTETASTSKSVKGDFDPIAWWAGVGDYAGYDMYASSITDRPATADLYPRPEDFCAGALQLASAAGRSLYVPELGSIRQGAKPVDDGTLRAQWIAQVVSYLRAAGCAGVSWWDALGANDRDFRLDPFSLQAWKQVIAGQHSPVAAP